MIEEFPTQVPSSVTDGDISFSIIYIKMPDGVFRFIPLWRT